MKNFDRNTHTPACTRTDSHQTCRLYFFVVYSCNFFIFKYISCHKRAQNKCVPPPMHSQGNVFDLHSANPVYITAADWGWKRLEGWDWSKWKKRFSWMYIDFHDAHEPPGCAHAHTSGLITWVISLLEVVSALIWLWLLWCVWVLSFLCFKLVWMQCDSDWNENRISGKTTNKLYMAKKSDQKWLKLPTQNTRG